MAHQGLAKVVEAVLIVHIIDVELILYRNRTNQVSVGALTPFSEPLPGYAEGRPLGIKRRALLTHPHFRRS